MSYDLYYGIRPEDWIQDAVYRVGDASGDGSIAFRLWFIGKDYAFARVNMATTTHDVVFRQGTATGTAATIGSQGASGLSNLNGANPTNVSTAGSVGWIDMSNANVNNMFKLVERINNYRSSGKNDWCAALIDSLPTDAVELSAGNGLFLPGTTTTTGGRASTSAAAPNNLTLGADIPLDSSLKAKDIFYAGVTLNNSCQKIPSTDNNVLHEILEIRLKATFATTAGSCYYSICNDRTGVVESTTHLKVMTVASTATEHVFGNGTGTFIAARGRRIVVWMTAGCTTTAISMRSPYIKILRRSGVFGSNIRRRNLLSYVEQA